MNQNTSGTAESLTNAALLGEIVWLFTQSPLHKLLPIKDLEWLVMPPLLLKQFKLFHDDAGKPIGVALWAYLSETAEETLISTGRIEADQWAVNMQASTSGVVGEQQGNAWLIELVSPFHSEANQHRDSMLSDLINTRFKSASLNVRHINPETKTVETVVLNPSSAH